VSFSEEQIERYSRHIILEDVGVKGQNKILESKVLIIGAGGLGSPAALYLAAAGVGTIGIVDNDIVDLTNLQRQVIHFTPDVGKPKVESAKEKIEKLNPDVEVRTYKDNDACVLAKKPFSHGGILRFDGQTMTYTPGNTCYRCVFSGLPPKNAIPNCAQAGVLGSIAGILGTIQATEALKFIIGRGELLINRLLIFDALDMDFRTITLQRNKSCAICGENPTISKLEDYEQTVCEFKNENK